MHTSGYIYAEALCPAPPPSHAARRSTRFKQRFRSRGGAHVELRLQLGVHCAAFGCLPATGPPPSCRPRLFGSLSVCSLFQFLPLVAAALRPLMPLFEHSHRPAVIAPVFLYGSTRTRTGCAPPPMSFSGCSQPRSVRGGADAATNQASLSLGSARAAWSYLRCSKRLPKPVAFKLHAGCSMPCTHTHSSTPAHRSPTCCSLSTRKSFLTLRHFPLKCTPPPTRCVT